MKKSRVHLRALGNANCVLCGMSIQLIVETPGEETYSHPYLYIKNQELSLVGYYELCSPGMVDMLAVMTE